MANNEEFFVRIRADIEDFKQGMKQVGDSVSDVGAKISGAGSFMTKGLTAPIVAGAGLAVAAFNTVDGALDTIITKTGATGETAEALEESFRNVGSKVPQDLQTVGDAIGEVNTQFGFMGEELEINTEKMLQFAEVNGTDVSQASIKAKQALSMFGMEAKELPVVLDAFTKSAQDSGQTTDYLMDIVSKNGPIFKSLGLDVSESAKMVGQFEKSGIDAGTAMSYLTKAQGVYAKDGVSLQDGLKNTIKGIKGAKNETEALALAQEAFGIKGAGKMVEGIKSGVLSLEDLATASKDASGAVSSTYEATLDPIDQSKIAMNNATLAMGEVGDAIQVALLPFLTKLTEVLSAVAKWFGGLSPQMKTVILVVAGLVAAIGPLLIVIGSLVSAFGAVLPIIGAVVGAFSLPVVAIVALVAGIGVAVYQITKHWDTIWAKTKEIFDAIANFFTEWGVGVKERFVADVEAITTFFSTAWNSIQTKAVEIFTAIGTFFTEWGLGVKERFTADVLAITTFFSTAWNSVQTKAVEIFTAIKTFFIEWGLGIKERFVADIGAITNFFSTAWTSVSTKTIEVFTGIATFFVNIFATIRETISGAIGSIVEFFSGFIVRIKEGMTSGLGGILTSIVQYAVEMKNKALTMGVNIVEGIIVGIKSIAGKAVQAMKDFATGGILGPFANILDINSPSGAFIENAKHIVDGMAIGMKQNAKTGIRAVENFANDLTSSFNPELSTEGSFDLNSSLSGLQAKGSQVASQVSANKTQTIILEGDLAPLVSRVKTDVASDVSTMTSGRLI